MLMTVAGIPIEVCRKKIKNMHLHVKAPEGRVSVSAPLNMHKESIECFVRAKLDWIKKHINAFEDRPPRPERGYVSGETLYVWGKQYFLLVEYVTGKNSLILSGDKAILGIRRESQTHQRKKFVTEWYRGILKDEIIRLLPKWEKATGLKAASWQTKYMTTRWGTCNTRNGKIWINLQLSGKTIDCLEYVILHELVHLVEKNHNEKFFSLMDQYMPFWRDIKKKLNGQIPVYVD